ncbi:putative Glycosyltransferase family 1 protein [Candidatus Hydrogenisulfobacillus filiaventi]|uniref:Putative Glycosyltransferase family 1 protein n=1 Tax=Candidatus Hydrogenisulfobacillus filiaventi TaxID=2707344 RepID=A0A6F8ZCU7_9FIRM|nr:putative Glycosyltransferase family 1 protein [Candidatus Hydrogenisulfobacillus filiaventi]
MHVVQVITSAAWGGAQQHVYDLARALRRRGHSVTVVYGVPGPLADRLAAAGIPALSEPALGRLLVPWRDGRALAALVRLLRALAPDVIHAHSSKAGALVRLAAPRLPAPVVYTVHGLVYQNARMPAWKRAFYHSVEAALLPRAAAVIAVSRADLAELERLQGGRDRPLLAYIPNGIDPARFPVDPPLPDAPVFGTVARFVPEKALDVLVEAFARVRARWPEARLLLVGDGPGRPELERRIRRLGLEAAVEFPGYQPDPLPWLLRMRVFVLSSVKEGAPYTLLEALALRRLVVATAVGAIPDLLRGRAGAGLVPPGDVSALAEAMSEVVGLEASWALMVPTTDAMVEACLAMYHAVREHTDINPGM